MCLNRLRSAEAGTAMSQDSVARASVATEKPVPYMRQLCKHFGHRIPAEYDDLTGWIQFDGGRLNLDASGSAVLELTITADDEQQRERLEGVVGSHLERFGRGDELVVSWDQPI
jgi:hypothetical protein